MAPERSQTAETGRADGLAVRGGIIFDIRRFSIHDGPGIRTTVFLKGCPLSCQWCHNPEGIRPGPEPWLRVSRCRACGACGRACRQGAIAVSDGRAVTDASRCILCGRCVDVCPAAAREIAGRTVTAEEVLAEIEKDQVFYEESGGGATFSGGEPLAQVEFLRELLAGCRQCRIHTAVDTTCHAPWEDLRAIAELADLLLCDVKHMEDAAHRRLTGMGNGLILANLTRLAEAGRPIILRMPLIGGANDEDANVEATGRFVAALGGLRRLDVLPYHEGGRNKLARLGRQTASGFRRPAEDRLAAIVARLEQFGLNVKVGG